jgi:hypothetical protein
MRRALCGAAAGLIFVGYVVACGRTPPQPPVVGSSPQLEVAGGSAPEVAGGAPAATGAATGATAAVEHGVKNDHEIGAPKVFDNLTILPVTSKAQEDIGPITSLEDALAKKTAVVREMGADANANLRTNAGSMAMQIGAGPQVNSLVIENKGTIPIYVLAGTIVKGGNQDRQIGDDFIVGANETVPVEAYCVEHGRWTAQREGVATGGQFGVVGLLTDSTVRTAAQYKHDQGEVWSKVAQVNAANRKEATSGTLMASVDASDVAARRVALAQKVDGYLRTLSPSDSVVGFAYAVDGKVRSVRWFTNHKLFELFRGVLVNTAAMEAITVQAQDVAAGLPAAAPTPIAPAAVTNFVDDVQKARLKEERSTPALNVNDVRETTKGYSSSTVLKAPPSQPHAKPRPVSTSVGAF